MDPIASSIRYPVTVAVGVLIALLGGVLAVVSIPVQLTPDIDELQVWVRTYWPGASPEEIEKEIIDEQEEYLKTVEGLVEMRSESYDGWGQVSLEFEGSVDLTGALVRVTNKLNEVPSYPQTAERPVVATADPFAGSIAWFILRSTDPSVYAPHEGILLEDVIKPRLERVRGVAGINFFGNLFRELHVTFDPDLLASTGITVAELAAAIRAESQDISGGDFGEGKRRYVVRTMGRYRSIDDVAATVVKVRGGVPIRVGDVARVELAYEKPLAMVRFQGEPAIAFAAQREIGSNTLDIMEDILAEAKTINEEVLKPRGLQMECVWDESLYIRSSVDRVLTNIYLGAALAIVVLFLFLRSATSILVVALSIPISVVTAFLTLFLLGRTINIVSLAGMAFAVGMVVDNAIVVLENVYRHLQMGKRRAQAAYDGAREVWGAVFASTLTTVAVFLPIVFIEERAGQLFRDISLAIASAIVVSLLVAVTVIPTASARILKVAPRASDAPPTFLERLAARISALVDFVNAGALRRLAVIAAIVVLSLGLTWRLLPAAEYLPNGNMNFIFGILVPPPGYNIEEMLNIGRKVESELAPYWEASKEEAPEMAGGGGQHFWFVAFMGMPFFGFEARDPARVRELLPVVNEALTTIPGSIGIAMQESLFSQSLVGTRSVRIDVVGPDLTKVLEIATRVFTEVGQVLPGSSSRPVPGLDLGNPEVRVYPDRVRAADCGFNAAEIGTTVNSLVDGMKVAEYFHEGRKIDLILKGSDDWSRHTQSIAQLPLATPNGQIITLGDVAEVRQRQGAVQINHVERQRAVSVETALPDNVPLEEAIRRIEDEIVEPMHREGLTGGLYEIRLRGAADDLSKLRAALQTNFLVVVLLTFLLLAALFQSFLYPWVIMATVPLATFGGVLGLRLIHVFVPGQQMDILTMLGFVILVGTVINNAILIVYHALGRIREGDGVQEAVRESVRVRVRPILMSTTTSCLGMLPLVVMPGAGSELYRGLGSVVVGGLVVSTVITLFLTPLVFTVAYEMRRAVVSRFSGEPVATGESASTG